MILYTNLIFRNTNLSNKLNTRKYDKIIEIAMAKNQNCQEIEADSTIFIMKMNKAVVMTMIKQMYSVICRTERFFNI